MGHYAHHKVGLHRYRHGIQQTHADNFDKKEEATSILLNHISAPSEHKKKLLYNFEKLKYFFRFPRILNIFKEKNKN